MVAKLASANSGMNFGQVLRRDANEPRKQLRNLVAKTVPVTQASTDDPLGRLFRLKFVTVKNTYGNETHASLDKEAVTNLMT